MQINLFGKTHSEIVEAILKHKLPKYTAKQICEWIYQKKVNSFSQMTNISKNTRSLLQQHYYIETSVPVDVQTSGDGTKKYLFKAGNSGLIESAYIPDKNRKTLCVSSQVGCKMRCLFCMTGRQGLKGQLTAGQIINQVWSLPESDELTNIVYMGMGEPLDNLAEVMKSLEILTADWGMAFSSKRITVSTIGIIPAMKHFIENSNCHLAVSLHSPFEAERKMLMPVSHKYTINDILNEIKKHNLGRQRRVSFEYIVFSGLNDTPAHVKELARILNGINCRINLIRFHSIPNTQLNSTTEQSITAFREALSKKGIITTIRASRGQDIDAACGLLSTKNKD